MTVPLRIVVLTTAKVGVAAAVSLAELPAVERVTLVTAPVHPSRRGFTAKLRSIYHYRGIAGLLAAAGRRIRRPRAGSLVTQVREHAAAVAPHLAHIRVADIRGPDCQAALSALAPDLGVVVAAPILPRPIFSLPALGSINLHFGKAPEYRGSSPGFWELMAGERAVGVTVHRVTEQLDGGDILLQECFPIDPAPAGDPLKYLAGYWTAVLAPEGIRLIGNAVSAIAAGTAVARTQDPEPARTFRRASYAAQRELRRRVAERRRTLGCG